MSPKPLQSRPRSEAKSPSDRLIAPAPRDSGLVCATLRSAISVRIWNVVIARGLSGGHAAPETQLRRIHEASLANLPQAIREMDEIRVCDNAAQGRGPRFVLSALDSRIVYVCPLPPEWLKRAMLNTEYEIT
jgi:hypothetical protein